MKWSAMKSSEPRIIRDIQAVVGQPPDRGPMEEIMSLWRALLLGTVTLKIHPDAKILWSINKPLKFLQFRDADSIISSGQGCYRGLTGFPRAGIFLFPCWKLPSIFLLPYRE